MTAIKSNKILGLEKLKNSGFTVPEFDYIPDFTLCGLALEDLDVNFPSKKLTELIRKKVKKLNTKNGISIRSASFDEDSGEQSSAGRYLSFNGLKTEKEIAQAAVQIWLHHRTNSKNTTCPLIIQETHPSFFSGVAFKDKDVIVIESFFGACSNTVEGCITPYRTTIKDGKITHNHNKNNYPEVFSVHKNIFKNKVLTSGCLLQAKSPNFTQYTRFYRQDGPGILKVYGRKPQKLFDAYESKIIPQLIKIISVLDNEKGVDIEWGTDASSKVFLYQFRQLTKKIADFYQTPINTKFKESEIYGIPSSRGIAKGKVTDDPGKIDKKRDILFLEYENLDDVGILENVKAVISTRGGLLSHLSIICRELNIPCVVCINKPVPFDTSVEVNGDTGLIKILD